MSLSNIFLGSLLAIVCLAFFIVYAKCLYKFVLDGADLRVVFLTIFAMLLIYLMYNLLSCFHKHDYYLCFHDGSISFFLIVLAKLFPTASFWMLLSCNLIGYKTLYTNKPFKLVSYVTSWAAFLFVVFFDVIILKAEIGIDDVMLWPTVSKLTNIFSYSSIDYDSTTLRTWSIIKFSYYILNVIGAYIFNKLECRKITNKKLFVDILAIVVLLLCEIFGSDSFQKVFLLKFGSGLRFFLNAALTVSYICFIVLLFIIEAVNVYNCTKPENDWKEKMIKETLEHSKAYRRKNYGKKMRAEIEVLADAISKDFIKNPDYLDTLSFSMKRKDEKFWKALSLELEKRKKLN